MYKLYENKSSLSKLFSRYLQGGTSTMSGDKIAWWERTDIPKPAIDDIPITIDAVYAKRPDLVAFDYYGTTELEWVILQYNNIVDIMEEFTYGTKIVIPSNSRVRNSIAVKSSASK